MRSPIKKPARGRRRRYPVSRIKQTCYDPADIAKLFGVHRNTVRHWLKDGLQPIDDQRPPLVHGSALKSFITERQEARRQTCRLGELFCFRCRAPRKPWGNMADVSFRTDKIAKLTAFCCICETVMNVAIRCADLPKLATLIDLQPMASERLNDRPAASANRDSRKDRRDVETEPAK